MPDNERLSIMGRERALLDALTAALNRSLGSPTPSHKTMRELRRHRAGTAYPTARGNAYEVQIGDPDGKPTGHIARVTVELDRFETDESAAALDRFRGEHGTGEGF